MGFLMCVPKSSQNRQRPNGVSRRWPAQTRLSRRRPARINLSRWRPVGTSLSWQPLAQIKSNMYVAAGRRSPAWTRLNRWRPARVRLKVDQTTDGLDKVKQAITGPDKVM